ncbi:MAG TPA: FAD-dependent oxidoreductase [Gaiellaceae bacterium]|jgi:sulfide:quinone oxidoreductase|nr:FAD-dependent oxidoreductase [Gaiellaceae bacterium]
MSEPLHVLIAGGGVAALEATLALRVLAEERVDIELLAPDADFVYRPMAVAEPFQQGEVKRFPLARLAELAGARLTPGTLARVDLDNHRVETADGTELKWDVLLVALGAGAREGIAGGLTFRGPDERAALTEIVDDAVAGRVQSLTFALPTRAAWPLPLYELALMTKIRLEDAGATAVRVDLVTPEAEPLAVFGREASESIKSLLETRGIGLRTHTTPVVFRSGALVVVPGRAIRTERVISLPVPEGRRIPGLPTDGRGFVRADDLGQVEGRDDVYAAGDITTFPLKQGGIATQQADAAAESIAALAGAPVTPRPFKPVLRGLLLTGLTPRFMAASPLDASSEVDSEPLWWPPAKIVGRYLAPFLAQHVGLSAERPPEALAANAVEVDVELERIEGDWVSDR